MYKTVLLSSKFSRNPTPLIRIGSVFFSCVLREIKSKIKVTSEPIRTTDGVYSSVEAVLSPTLKPLLCSSAPSICRGPVGASRTGHTGRTLQQFPFKEFPFHVGNQKNPAAG
ncbi:hypothetical protein ATANTOWER_017028 [Ataeniobius toweri]|uniref:Uncharacterized protein n=1 Tax=Ataeniobius toweri TaxID=208326 RepID=A0ABU7BG26_9TELE|nr:hypothetical protein [Ataeniobius toweri]